MNYLLCGFWLLLIYSCSPTTDDLYRKAYELEDKTRYKEASAVFDKLIKQHPKYQDAYYGKGYCYLQDSDYVNALSLFEQVLSLKGISDSSKIIIEFNSDLPFGKESLRHQVDLTELYYRIGITKYCMDSLRSSFSYFQYAIDNRYEVVNCYCWQGLILIRLGKKEKGCELLNNAAQWGDDDGVRLHKQFCEEKTN